MTRKVFPRTSIGERALLTTDSRNEPPIWAKRHYCYFSVNHPRERALYGKKPDESTVMRANAAWRAACVHGARPHQKTRIIKAGNDVHKSDCLLNMSERERERAYGS